MQLNEAVSKRLTELLSERNMTQYQLFMKSGVPKSTIGNVINCSYESVKLRIIHEMCQGLGITLLAGERKAQQDIANIHQWAGTIRQYLDLQELNREIIEELIDRIEVGERTVIDGQRHQDIKIYYRFVGLV